MKQGAHLLRHAGVAVIDGAGRDRLLVIEGAGVLEVEGARVLLVEGARLTLLVMECVLEAVIGGELDNDFVLEAEIGDGKLELEGGMEASTVGLRLREGKVLGVGVGVLEIEGATEAEVDVDCVFEFELLLLDDKVFDTVFADTVNELLRDIVAADSHRFGAKIRNITRSRRGMIEISRIEVDIFVFFFFESRFN